MNADTTLESCTKSSIGFLIDAPTFIKHDIRKRIMEKSMSALGSIEPRQLEGSETFQYLNQALPHTVRSFWRWAYSNLPANNLRGHLAEFIVASDFGITSATRIEWADYDLLTKSKYRVEVKSAAYLQSWGQSKLSAISYDIAPTKPKDQDTETFFRGAPIRNSDAYVFCLLKHKDKPSLDPLNLDQWTFYVLPTAVLNAKSESQKTLTMGSLLSLHPDECKYGEIATKIDQVLGDTRTKDQQI